MATAPGFVAPTQSIGENSFFIRPLRGFFPNTVPNAPSDSKLMEPITAQATIEEEHDDEMQITQHPIEIGAPIADHAFKRPATVTLRLGWSNSPNFLSVNTIGRINSGGLLPTSGIIGTNTGQTLQVYAQLLNLQQNRVLFDLWTGKRHYTSMMLSSLRVSTDKNTENVLSVTAVCQQVFIVQTESVSVPPNSNQATPQKTGAVSNLGDKQLGSAQTFPLPNMQVTALPLS